MPPQICYHSIYQGPLLLNTQQTQLLQYSMFSTQHQSLLLLAISLS
jgi:hypothetical protein